MEQLEVRREQNGAEWDQKRVKMGRKGQVGEDHVWERDGFDGSRSSQNLTPYLAQFHMDLH